MNQRIKTKVRHGGTVIVDDKDKQSSSAKQKPKDKEVNSNVGQS